MLNLKKFISSKIYFKFLIVILVFSFDRVSKIYIFNLIDDGYDINFYINPFLNIYLVWNTGIGFGFLSSNSELFYNIITTIIAIINLLILYLIFKINDVRKFFLLIIMGGSLGNLFDRIYYSAVADFIDFHIGNFHWFIFNIADVFISIGVFCLIIYEIFINKKKK